MKNYYLIILAFSVLLVSGCQSPGVSAYHRGNEAYKKRHYTLAFTNYLDAAQQGITPAQYAVGYQYYYGQGTPENYLKSMQWFAKAAPKSLRAQYALNQIKNITGTQPWAVNLHWPTKQPK